MSAPRYRLVWAPSLSKSWCASGPRTRSNLVKTDSLLKDPVFQLNLLRWMAKEHAADRWCVRPLFFHEAFRIIYIEHPFPFPEETAIAIKRSQLPISVAPEPDLLLGRQA